MLSYPSDFAFSTIALKKSSDIGRIIEVNDRRGYFLADVKRKVRTVQVCAWYKDVILPNIEKV